MRGGGDGFTYWAHIPKTVGSSPTPATRLLGNSLLIKSVEYSARIYRAALEYVPII